MRLRDILKAKIHHDAHRDLPLMEAIDAYVMNKRTPVEGKYAALRKLDDVLSLPHPGNEAFALKTYVATRAEDFA